MTRTLIPIKLNVAKISILIHFGFKSLKTNLILHSQNAIIKVDITTHSSLIKEQIAKTKQEIQDNQKQIGQIFPFFTAFIAPPDFFGST